VQIIALDTFTSVSCNAKVLMSERLALVGSLLHISSFTLGMSTWSQLLGFLYFWRISFLFTTEYSALKFPFINSARLLTIGGPMSSEQLREEQISVLKLVLLWQFYNRHLIRTQASNFSNKADPYLSLE